MKKLSNSLFFIFFIMCTLSAQDEEKSNSIKSALKRNSIYIENLVILPSINYDRILPLNYKSGIILKAGLSYYDRPFLITEASLLTVRIKNFFEIGGGWGGKNYFGIY
jgi:hypothetical protein